jgi:anaerobic magnesium-protoporphyrin IX monomethyl ester cyclase
VNSLDANVLLYEWLFSDDCAERLVDAAALSRHTQSQTAAYRAMFANAAAFRADIDRLREPRRDDETDKDFVARNYLAVEGFETYLDAVSEISGEFVISPYAFHFSSRNLEAKALERRLLQPPALLEEFVRATITQHVLPQNPTVVGLSCIGQEQLYFTLLFGRLLKEASQAQVLIGGTIFSRIFERGALKPDWFGRYFDIIVRNEGERPSERLLANVRNGERLTDVCPASSIWTAPTSQRRSQRRRSGRSSCRCRISTISRWATTCRPRSLSRY